MRGGGGEHRVGEGRVERRAVRLRIGRVALDHRRGQRALGRRRVAGQPVGVGGGADRARIGRGVHRRVDVGAVREGFAPPAHRALRIEPLRLAERRDRGGMVEAVSEGQALAEVALRLGAGRRDREVRGCPGRRRAGPSALPRPTRPRRTSPASRASNGRGGSRCIECVADGASGSAGLAPIRALAANASASARTDCVIAILPLELARRQYLARSRGGR